MTSSSTYTKGNFYYALHQVESSGLSNPNDGDNGKSIGPYQIQQGYWKDSGIGGKYSDVRKLSSAQDCVNGWMKRYAKSEWGDSMTKDECETCARRHNGGPKGDTKTATDHYWNKFQKHLSTNTTE